MAKKKPSMNAKPSMFEEALDGDFTLNKLFKLIVSAIAVSMALFHLITSFTGILPSWQHRMLHVGVVLILIFCLHPCRKISKWNLFFDGIPLALSVFVTGYTFLTYPEVVLRSGELILEDYVIGTILTLLILEATRRMTGWAMTIIAIFFLLYVYFGQYLPGLLGHPGFSYDMLIETLYVGTSGIVGAPIYVSSTVLIIFVIFGAFLVRSGTGAVFIEFAYALTGSLRGGPALTAVSSSALVGSITGAGIANVAITGTFTIPLMKRVGYSRNFAAAVEAVASQGGQIMPPIMGASAFIIAEFLGLRYLEVVVHATVGAIIYFSTAGLMIYLEACKLDLKGLPRKELPDWRQIFKESGLLFFPLPIVIVCLFLGYSAMRAGFIGIMAIFVFCLVKRATRMNLTDVLAALEGGMKGALTVASTCACCGIIVAAISLTGVGLRFSRFAIMLGGGEIAYVLIFVMLASLILGMGMTTVSAYILAAVLGAPALIESGVSGIAAHLFVFYFAILSGLTPPVALTSYAAAAVAESDPQKTSYYSLKLALGGFLVPFMLVIKPGLLLIGSTGDIVCSIVFSLLGAFLFACGIQGYMFSFTEIWERILLLISGSILLFATGPTIVFGFMAFCIVLFSQKKRMQVAG